MQLLLPAMPRACERPSSGRSAAPFAHVTGTLSQPERLPGLVDRDWSERRRSDPTCARCLVLCTPHHRLARPPRLLAFTLCTIRHCMPWPVAVALRLQRGTALPACALRQARARQHSGPLQQRPRHGAAAPLPGGDGAQLPGAVGDLPAPGPAAHVGPHKGALQPVRHWPPPESAPAALIVGFLSRTLALTKAPYSRCATGHRPICSSCAHSWLPVRLFRYLRLPCHVAVVK